MVLFRHAHYGGCDKGFLEHPRYGDLRLGDVAVFGDFCDAIDDGFVGVFGFGVEGFSEFVCGGALGAALLVPGAGEAASGERTPWDYADAFGLAELHHFSFFFAVEEVVVILHGDEARPAVLVGEIESFAELPGVHAAGADVAGFAGFHYVVQGFESFFDWGLVIPAVGLIEIDIVGAESAEAVIDFGEDCFAGQAAAVGVFSHGAVDFGGEDDFIALGEITECAADDFFAGSVGIDVGGVEEVDACVEGFFYEGSALFFVQGPEVISTLGNAVAHAAEADAGDFEAGFS